MLPAMNTYEHSGILIPFGVAEAIQGDQVGSTLSVEGMLLIICNKMGRSSGCT